MQLKAERRDISKFLVKKDNSNQFLDTYKFETKLF
jgi:hypothetical protein